MAKFYGTIGYVKTVETEPGMWEEQKTGDFLNGKLSGKIQILSWKS